MTQIRSTTIKRILIFASIICIAVTPAFAQLPQSSSRTKANIALEEKLKSLNLEDTLEEAFNRVQQIAKKSIDEKNWAQAIRVYEKYRPSIPSMSARFDEIINMLKTPSDTLLVSNLGENINSQVSEVAPIPTLDGTQLYFARIYPRYIKNEDVWVSTITDGKWGKALNYISRSAQVRITGVSTDGNELLMHINGDLTHLQITKDSLQVLPELPINTDNYESDGVFSPDNQAILFVSDRPGGIGGYSQIAQQWDAVTDITYNTDIYVIVRIAGGWSDPINLGSVINTRYAERSPYLHADGKTLYFSSSGHYGLGGYDVFKSTRLREDSWTEWSEPVNLGKDINSTGNDYFYSVTLDGSVAYYAGQKSSGYGNSDIYSVTLPSLAKPLPVATITGKILDEEGKTVVAEIVWEDLTTKKEVGRLKSKPVDGSYFIVLPLGKKYGYHAELQGYYPKSEHIDLTHESGRVIKVVDITLTKKEKLIDRTVIINNLFFDFDSDTIKSESYPELERLIALLREIPHGGVTITGHTDNSGTEAYNSSLSTRRASAVVKYLVGRGLDARRFIKRGMGARLPIVNNDSEENRALNRRVEFKILR
jgi:outer membrane protein OmpA-like peptidoglycan-associated protein